MGYDPGLAAFDAAAAGAPDPGLAAFDAAVSARPKRITRASYSVSPNEPSEIPAPVGDDVAADYVRAVGDPAYVKAVRKGAAHAVGIPSSGAELKQAAKDALVDVATFPVGSSLRQMKNAMEGGYRAYLRAKAAPSGKRVAQAVVSGVPLVGEPIAAVAGPGLAISEGRAPTHEENVTAVEGGTTLGVLGAGALHGARAARLENIRRAHGIAPEAPATAPESATAPEPPSPATEALVADAGEAQRAARTKASTPPKVAPPSASIDAADEVSDLFQKRNQLVADEAGKESVSAPPAEPIATAGVERGGRVLRMPQPAEPMSPHEEDLHRNIEAGMPVDEALGRYQAAYEKASGFHPESEIKDARPFTGKSLADMTDDELDAEAGRLAGLADRAYKSEDWTTGKAYEAAFEKTTDEANRRWADGEIQTARENATTDAYRKYIDPIEEGDVPLGERYRIDELFDKSSSPADIADGKAIYDGFSEYRDLLRQKHGNTMRLYRADVPAGRRLPNKTVLHFADTEEEARGHMMESENEGRTLVARDVPIDDIVAAPSHGKGKNSEYLVLNRDSPNAIDHGVPDGGPPPPANGNGGSGNSGGNPPPSTPPSGPPAPPTPAETHHDMAGVPVNPAAALAAAKRTFAPVKEVVDAINPSGASPEAAGAADILRKSKSEIANDATIERARNKQTAKAFETAGDAKNIESISNYETTGRFMKGDAFPDQASADAYSNMYRETTDAAHQSLRQTYGDDRVGFVDNYVRRAFKFGSAADEAKATGVLSNWIGSLSASKSPLKGRTLGVPLDQALQTMRDAGIEVRPATTNPEILRQWTVENANQARVYKQAWTDARLSNLIQFVRQGARIPEGLVELNDRVAKVFRPTEEGPVQTGRYFAEPGVARIFNNAISKGLGGSPTFRAVRGLNNAYNQMQLGLSAFHLTGTAINAGISDLSLGLQQIIQGDVGGGATSIVRSTVPGLSFVRDLYHGRAFINDLIADDPIAHSVMREELNPSGGRLAIDQSYRNAAAQNLTRAWSNGRYLRVIGNAPLAIIQKIASPLMDYAIPRVKIGAFLDLADVQRQKLGLDASPTDLHRAYQRAWDSIDNRFGQLVHDNLFWNRTAADLAQVGTRSVGWNLGTIRELGGGALDLTRGQLSQRGLYSFALPVYAGLIGAVYMFLHTGKLPQTTRDYYYPPNGLTDNKGRDDRVALPTYMKDVFAYSSHPVTTLEHKASPLLSLAFDLGTNRDYFGDMIRNPDESVSRQWMQNGAYALKQFRPFSIQQAGKTLEEGGPLQAGEQFMGFVKAPAEVKQAAEQSDAARERRRLINEEKMRRAAEKHGQ